MSKFSKHNQKPKLLPKEGILMVSNGGAVFKVSEIFEQEGQRMVKLTIEHEGEYVEVYPPYPVRDFIVNIRNKTWCVIKDGPIEPEKILKEFKFI